MAGTSGRRSDGSACSSMLANVAVLELFRIGPARACGGRTGGTLCRRFVLDVLLFDTLRWKHVRGVEDRPLSKRSDACCRTRGFVLPDPARPAIARGSLGHTAPLYPIGTVDPCDCLEEAMSIVDTARPPARFDLLLSTRADRWRREDARCFLVMPLRPEYPEADLRPIVCWIAYRRA